ncbi:MAG TPA: energy-coupling factor transporter transmembrane component T, partial [Paracoccaceae bacterium]|nr:energy-coupling factor transporter transmembrane component T [Paracoccaceae bacterium]
MLRRIDPLTKLVVCLVWIAASSLVLDSGFQLVTIGLVAILLVLVDRMPVWLFLAASTPFALFGFGFLTSSVLFHAEHGYVTAVAAEAPFRGEAASTGVALCLRALACGLVSLFFARTVEPGALVRALMARAGLPARWGYALFAALNAAPDLAADLRLMRLARAMRRGEAPRRIIRPGELAGLAVPLLAGAIRRAGQTAIAMEARGLARTGRPALIGVPRFGTADGLFALA